MPPAEPACRIEIAPRGLRLPQAHSYIGIGQKKFLELVHAGRMPKPARLDGCTLWDRRALDEALDVLFEASDLPEAGKIIL